MLDLSPNKFIVITSYSILSNDVSIFSLVMLCQELKVLENDDSSFA